jgi:hypothetical protein
MFTRSPWTHTFIVGPDDTAIEAWPGGVRSVPLATYRDGRRVAYSDDRVGDVQRGRIVAAAVALIGVGYDFLSLGLHTLRVLGAPVPVFGLPGTILCPQLVILAGRAGGQDWTSGLPDALVTPMTLGRRLAWPRTA